MIIHAAFLLGKKIMGEIRNMPAVIINDVVLLPGMTVNFSVIKAEASRACVEAMRLDQLVFVAAQKEGKNDVTVDSLYEIGTVAHIKQITKLPNKTVQLMLESKSRGKLLGICNKLGTEMSVEFIGEEEIEDPFEKEAMLRNLRELFLTYDSFNSKAPKNILRNLRENDDLSSLVDEITGNIQLPYELKMDILQTVDLSKRYDRLTEALLKEIKVLELLSDLKKKTSEKVAKNQRDYYLREQLATIKKELNIDSESEEEELLNKLSKLKASDEVKEKIKKEISKLATMNSGGSETFVQRNYIETLLELPWDNESEDNLDIKNAREVLERDHFGLAKVKERVLEFLAVRALNTKGDTPIICLVGPPGTGKTSIAKSIAEALNKEYVRISLGGVHDEAEIRGHRRTYVGAMPGNIVQALKQAHVKNPLMLLDEIDKSSGNHKGETASALLEVLDSEQNSHFIDHFINIPIDLSGVLFIATANNASDIPRPLYDRMEIIEVTSYTANEKFHIAKEHLLSKQFEKNGLSAKQINISDSAITKIIEAYTKEAGVRELERKIGTVARKAAIEILEGNAKKVKVTAKNLSDFLGKEKYRPESKNKKDQVGIVRGLAWTSVGGTTLPIEVNIMPGQGHVELTGQMGDVMKESAMAGISYIRSIASKYKIKPDFFKKNDIHIHIPEGAVPKDGPSAGISMATAVLSAITGIPVRANLAMTGEITIRGRVLAVGGLKEKILAAKMAGITKILVPSDNKADIMEISEEIREGLEIVFVETETQVVEHAFTR